MQTKETMRYLLLCLMLILLAVPASPQGTWVLLNKNDLLMGSCSVENSYVIDSALMTVSYSCIFNKEDSIRCEIAQLQVGANYTRFYGLNRWRADSVYTASYWKTEGLFNVNSKAQNKKCLSFEIIRNSNDGELYNIHRLAFQHDRVIQYNEKNLALIWKISEQIRTIGGYLCYEAETHFGGRVWQVWFTPEVSVDAGPWKLSGLPGLILEASDASNDYQFKFRGITQMLEPILRHKYNTKLVSKKHWLQYEKTLYQAPKTILQAAANAIFYTYDSDTDEVITLNDNWTIPYNPIERE